MGAPDDAVDAIDLHVALDTIDARDRRIAELQADLDASARRLSDEITRRRAVEARVVELEDLVATRDQELVWWQHRAGVLPCRGWWFLRTRTGRELRRRLPGPVVSALDRLRSLPHREPGGRQ